MMQSTDDVFVSWEEYRQLIEALAAKIHASKWSFNQILCLARGGLRIGDILSRIFDQPLAILSASSYGGEDFQTRGELRLANSLSMTEAQLGDRILIVDDLVDSGTTLAQSIQWLSQHYQVNPSQCRTAVLWFKASSEKVPDYFVKYYADNPWIHQPFEQYEMKSADELISNFNQTHSMCSMPTQK